MIYHDQIKTVKDFKESAYKEKKSVFIAQTYPILTIPETEEILKGVRKKYYDASHHCYAFKLADGTVKSLDAGEPNGTAGIRILNAIEHLDLTNVLLIVIRYFGGVKLGTGPLGKAYYTAAYDVIQNSEIIVRNLYQRILIVSDFEHLNIVQQVLSTYESRIESTEYGIQAKLKCIVIPKHSEAIKRALSDKSSGKVKYKPFGEYFYL